MDLGVVLTDVTSFMNTTFTGFGPILAAVIGLGLAIGVIRRFIKR